MKKTLISLAVAAAMVPAAAMADTSNVTVYGKVNVSYDRLDNDAEKGGFVSSNHTRLGFKGSEDLGDGLKAVFQYETAVNLDGTGAGAGLFGDQRDTFAGVSGSFGAVTLGRQAWSNLYKGDADFFIDGIGGPSVWLDGGKPRANNTIKYASPDMNGFNASLTYITPGGRGADNATPTASCAAIAPALLATDPTGENCQMVAGNTTESSYALRAAYNNGPLFAALTYVDEGSNAATPDTKVTSLAASYAFGPGKVAAQYVRAKDVNNNVGDDDKRLWTIGGSYKVTASGTVKVNYTDINKGGAATTTSNAGADMIAIGYDHALSKRTSVYATYARANNDSIGTYTVTGATHGASTGTIGAGKDASGLSLGMVHDF